MSRNNIIFYRSFYDAAQLLGDKARLKLYDSILKVSFSCYENIIELEQNCSEVETELKCFRNVFAQFSLIKPHILNSGKRYLNGKNGGAPIGNTNAKKQPKNKQLEIEEEIEEESIISKSKYFKKPTIQEIKNYCLEQKNNINPQYFFDYYEGCNWMRGKTKIKDWKATIRTWEQNSEKRTNVSNINKEGIDGWEL